MCIKGGKQRKLCHGPCFRGALNAKEVRLSTLLVIFGVTFAKIRAGQFRKKLALPHFYIEFTSDCIMYDMVCVNRLSGHRMCAGYFFVDVWNCHLFELLCVCGGYR